MWHQSRSSIEAAQAREQQAKAALRAAQRDVELRTQYDRADLVDLAIRALTGVEGKVFHPMAITVMLALGVALMINLRGAAASRAHDRLRGEPGFCADGDRDWSGSRSSASAWSCCQSCTCGSSASAARPLPSRNPGHMTEL